MQPLLDRILTANLRFNAVWQRRIQMTERELVITRMFDAPRELVWRAWTEPERLMRWWGPKGL